MSSILTGGPIFGALCQTKFGKWLGFSSKERYVWYNCLQVAFKKWVWSSLVAKYLQLYVKTKLRFFFSFFFFFFFFLLLLLLLLLLFTLWEFFTSILADGLSLEFECDSKSPQVSRILLSILAVLNNAVVWIVSSRPPTSKSSSPFNNPLVTVLKAPLTIGIIVTLIS